MASDDVVYGLLLFISLPLGIIVRVIPSPRYRELMCTVSGLALVILICKEDALHSIFLVITNTAIIAAASKNRFLHVYSFLWCFSYLAFFRTCHFLGIPKPSGHTNAVQLIITLKLVGVAAEVVETERLKQQLSNQNATAAAGDGDGDIVLRLKYKGIDWSWPRLLSYSWCYIGALTGPFYTCRTYQDMLHNQADTLPLWSDLKERLKPFPVCAVTFLLTSWLVSVQRAREESFYEDSTALYRWIYLFLLFIWFRVRFYCAWILAECIAVTAGLGAYPTKSRTRPGAGPTDLKVLDRIKTHEDGNKMEYDFETVRNILPYECETSTTIRCTFKSWNMCVQWWLAVHVYKNIPITNKFVRGFILMMISAFWHGIHPGLYATLLSAPFLLLAEDGMKTAIRSRLTSPRSLYIYDTISNTISIRFFEYFAVGVFFLLYDEIWKFWASLYFYGHFAIALIIIFGQTFSYIYPKQKDAIMKSPVALN